MRLCLALLVLFGATHSAVLSDDGRQAPASAQRPPNVIVIFADDLGYADIGPFATRTDAARPRTPHLDRMAAEGIRLTSFYAAQAVCSASRAALLTGNYPNRIGIRGALMPNSQIGLSDSEKTIAEVLKPRGYATAIYGKWHLGDNRQFLPTHHGFDEYLGLPYSNDMWPHHPQRKNFFPPLPLVEGDEVAEIDPDQSQLTRRYTERAVRFIERHRDTPFFVYVPHSMPHVPLFASDRVQGDDRRWSLRRRNRGDRLVRRRSSWRRWRAPASTSRRWSSSRPTTARGCRTGTTPDRPARSARERARRSKVACACRSSHGGPAGFPGA